MVVGSLGILVLHLEPARLSFDLAGGSTHAGAAGLVRSVERPATDGEMISLCQYVFVSLVGLNCWGCCCWGCSPPHSLHGKDAMETSIQRQRIGPDRLTVRSVSRSGGMKSTGRPVVFPHMVRSLVRA